MAGLTEAGFEKKSLDEIKTDVETRLRSIFGPFINLLPGSVFATIIGIFSDRIAEVWDVGEDTYNSQYPDTAEGVSLDNAAGYSGIERLEATESTATILLFGDTGTIVPAGTQVSVDGNPQAIFATDSQVELIDGANEIEDITFSAVPDGGTFTLAYGSEVTSALTFSANAATVETALNALPSLSGVTVTGNFTSGFTIEFDDADGLQPQALLVAVSSLTLSAAPITITVAETQAGIAQGTVTATATATGPKAAPTGTLTIINTPVSGLTRVNNPESAATGRDIETDAAFRIRRRSSLSIGGNASLEAIRAKLLNIEDVDEVIMFENRTNAIVSGRPAKSFEAVVDGGTDAAVAETIWKSKPAGIEPFGNTDFDIIDSQGDTRTISFSRAILIPIFASFDLTTDGNFPGNGVDLVKTAILNWAATLLIGADVVVYPQLIAQFNSVPGILGIRVRIDDAAVSTVANDPALDANIPIDLTERAEFSTLNLNVNVLP